MQIEIRTKPTKASPNQAILLSKPQVGESMNVTEAELAMKAPGAEFSYISHSP